MKQDKVGQSIEKKKYSHVAAKEQKADPCSQVKEEEDVKYSKGRLCNMQKTAKLDAKEGFEEDTAG